MSKVMNIGARIHSTEVGNVITGANEILDDTKHKKQNVINSEVDAELVRLDQAKQNVLTFDNIPTEGSNNPVKSDGVFAADKALRDAIEAILLLIPSAATALNQLADKNFVNSSISTATASFKGTYNLVSDLGLAVDATRAEIAEALASVIDMADDNDYSFVQIPVSSDNPTEIESTERYKFNGSAWSYEYTLNTSGFTAAQWDAINSGITQALVTKLGALPTASELAESLNGLSDEINGIKDVIPTEATTLNQLADKAYVLTQILAATPAFKGQFTTLTELEAVTGAKNGDLGIVRTKNHDGHDVFTFYQYKNNQWSDFYTMSYHPITKPATTGVFGNYPYNGMGKIELPMNMIDGAWTDNTWVYLPRNGVVYLLYSWHLQLYAVYNIATQEGLGLDDNLVVKDANYNINDIAEIVGERYLTFTEAGGVFTITKPDTTTITSTDLNNTTIYNYNDPSHEGVNVLTQAMLTQTNTIYVIRYDFDLNGASVTIPANCVLQFDGGSLGNANNIILGYNTRLVGKGAKIQTNGTIHVNARCTIEGINFERTTAMSNNEAVLLIDDNDFSQIGGESYVGISVKDCNFRYHIGDGSNCAGSIIELVSSGNFVYNGYYGVTFQNIHISSYADKAFYVHTESSGWISDLNFLYCMVDKAKNGWVINSNSNHAIEHVCLLACAAQAYNWAYHAVDAGKVNKLYITNCEFFDWYSASKYALNFTDTTGDVYVTGIKDGRPIPYTVNEVTRSFRNNIHIVYCNALLRRYIDLTNDVLLLDWYNLPNNVYEIESDGTQGAKIGLYTDYGGTLTVLGNGNMKFYLYQSNSRDSNSTKKEIKMMALVSKPDSITTLTSLASSLWTTIFRTSINTKGTLKIKDSYVQTRPFDYAADTVLPTIEQNSFASVLFMNDSNDIPYIWTGYFWKSLMQRIKADLVVTASNSRPNPGNHIYCNGLHMFDTTISKNRPIFYTGSKWVDANGYTAVRSVGTVAQMQALIIGDSPSLTTTDEGFCYYLTDYGYPCWLKKVDSLTVKWVKADGTDAPTT